MIETVILVPGIMGSQLFKSGNLIWPGEPHELLFPYRKMAELLDPNLEVGDIIRKVSISEQYDSLVEALNLCGFMEGDAKEGAGKPTLRACPYDWRKDNATSADSLAEQVRRMRADHGPGVVIDIVAHSMGGLVGRYFLESGKYSEAGCQGFDNVRRLITIGTPHRGTPLALCAALGQIKRLFLSAKQVRQLAERDEFPALYQLMPHDQDPFLWNTDPAARLDPVSLYKKEIAESLGLSWNNVQSAAKFHAALDVSRKPATVEYFCFVGTRQSTLGNVQADFSQPDLTPAGIEIADGGDGTVPSWSAGLTGLQQLAVGGEHGGLYKTSEVLQTLAALLGKPDALTAAMADMAVRISVRDEVVATEAPLVIVLTAEKAVVEIAGDLVINMVADAAGLPITPPVEMARLPLEYKGVPVQSLSIETTAPAYAGGYRLDLLVDGQSIAGNGAPVLVQSET